MMYPYLTLNDQTEITHSEMKKDGSVKVYIETPDENGGFKVQYAGFRSTDGKTSRDTQKKR